MTSRNRDIASQHAPGRLLVSTPVEAEEQEIPAFWGDVFRYGWRPFATRYVEQRRHLYQSSAFDQHFSNPFYAILHC